MPQCPFQESASFLYRLIYFSFNQFHKYLRSAYTMPGILKNSWLEYVLNSWSRREELLPLGGKGNDISSPLVLLKPAPQREWEKNTFPISLWGEGPWRWSDRAPRSLPGVVVLPGRATPSSPTRPSPGHPAFPLWTWRGRPTALPPLADPAPRVPRPRSLVGGRGLGATGVGPGWIAAKLGIFERSWSRAWRAARSRITGDR